MGRGGRRLEFCLLGFQRIDRILTSVARSRSARVCQERDTPMRRMKLRLVGAGPVAALSAGLVTWGGHSLPAQPKAAVPAKGGGKGDKKGAKSIYDENIPFTYPEERDAKN